MEGFSKKILVLLLVFALAFSLASCGSNASGESAGEDGASQESTAQESKEPESATENTATENSAPDTKAAKAVRWYVFKDLDLAMEVPAGLKIKALKDPKGAFKGLSSRIKITIKMWDRVSYPKSKDLAELVSDVTGKKAKILKQGGTRIVKVLGLNKSLRYYVISPKDDDYVITITPKKSKDKPLTLADIREETSAIEKSFRLPGKMPEGAEKTTLAKTKFPKPDYMVLVNYAHRMPKNWSSKADYVKWTNSRGNKVRAERTTYKAYLKLKRDLAKNDKVYIDIDFGLRTVKEQQEIMDDYTEKYGASYARSIVAKPGYSEHHTGLALDVYLIVDGKNIYLNEDMMKYPKLWEKIHAKLAKYGFILRYPKSYGKSTGYSYEPWHIRYVGVKKAKKIMAIKGQTLEMYLGK